MRYFQANSHIALAVHQSIDLKIEEKKQRNGGLKLRAPENSTSKPSTIIFEITNIIQNVSLKLVSSPF